MVSIIDPSTTSPVGVHTNQPLRMVAASSTNWWLQTNGSTFSQIGTSVVTLVWSTPASVTNRFTFDALQIIAQATQPAQTATGGLLLNLCEGPAAVLNVTGRIRNEALQEPPTHPDLLETDDPPLGFPLAMPGANRDGLGTVLLERAYEAGGPLNLASLYGPGLFVDTAGKLGSRTPIARNHGLGVLPSISSYHYGSFYFAYDFGRSRTLSLTRVLFEDTTAAANENVAIVRGDGRRNTYRYFNFNAGSGVTYYTAAAAVQNTLLKTSNYFQETTPSGTYYVYNNGALATVNKGAAILIADRYGNPTYFLYDTNKKLQKVQGVPGSGTQGLVPYLAYNSGLCSLLCLEDYSAAANNRTTYFLYDAKNNLIEITGPEFCTQYFAYDSTFNLLQSTDSENFSWKAYYDYNATGTRVTALVDALGQPAYYGYDTTTPITTWRDRAAKATYFLYNAWGSPLSVSNVGTAADNYSYENATPDATQSGNLLVSQNRLGQTWYYVYDPRGTRIAATDPLTAKNYFAYDTSYRLVSYTDPLVHQVYMAYDAKRNMLFKVDPLGNTAYYSYQGNGLVYFKQDRRGAFTYFKFDAAANLTAVRDPFNNATYYNYNSAADRIDMIDPLGRISYWSYDKRSRVTSTFDPLFAGRYYAYDAACNLITEVDPRGYATYHAYDGNDNRTQTTDPLGNATYFAYDPEDRLNSRKDARLNATTWTYDTLGRRQNQTDPFSNVKYWAYDAAHENTLVLDELKNASYLDYDAAGRAIQQKDALLNQAYIGYDLKGNRVLTLDKRTPAQPTYFYYDSRDQLFFSQNGVGAFNYFKYDPEQNRTANVDALGQPSYMNYDLRGLTTNTQDAYSNFTYWNYDAARQRTLQLLPPQNGSSVLAPTYWDYDLAGRPRNTTDSYLNTSYMAYDLSGNLTLTTNQRYPGNATTFQYFKYDPVNRQVETRDLGQLRTYYYFDSVGNRVQVDQEQGWGWQPWGTSPFGGERVSAYFFYDALNRQSNALSATSIYSPTVALTYVGYDAASNRVQTRVENPKGGADVRYSYWQYDVLNRVSKALDPNPTTSGGAAGVTYFGYDPNSNRVLVQDQENRFSYFTFDQLNRTQNQSDVFGDTTYMVYDLRDALKRRIDPVGRALYYDFDNLARQIRQSNALGQVAYMGYDARSERVISQNPRGFSTYFAFDLLGRLSTQKDALNGVRYFGYDQVGNKVLALDELNNPTYWAYDQANRAVVMTDALQNSFYYGYDAAGSLRQKVDADGRYTSYGYYGYDASRRPTTMSFDTDPWIYYAYDSVGNLTSSKDATGTNSFTYDDLDRVTSKVTLIGTVAWGYDKTGLKTKVVAPQGGGTYYLYDAASRLIQVSPFDAPGGAIRGAYYSYDASGLITKKLLPSNNAMAYLSYDTAARLSQLDNRTSTGGQVTYFGYSRDPNGNVVGVAHEGGVTTYYNYDALDRLTGEAWINSAGAAIYGFYYNYDAASNRLQKWQTVVTTNAQSYFTYDARNLLTIDKHKSGAFVGYTYYLYDKSHRMQQRASTIGLLGPTQYFQYDERDESTQYKNISVGGATTEVTYFTFNGLGERVFGFDGSGTGLSYFAFDGNKLLEEKVGSSVTLYRYNDTLQDSMGALVEHVVTDASKAYPMFDQSGSVKRVTSAAGWNYYEYDAPGVRLGATEALTETPPWRLEFASTLFLRSTAAALELYFSRHGIYLPSIERFTTDFVSFTPEIDYQTRVLPPARLLRGGAVGILNVFKDVLIASGASLLRCNRHYTDAIGEYDFTKGKYDRVEGRAYTKPTKRANYHPPDTDGCHCVLSTVYVDEGSLKDENPDIRVLSPVGKAGYDPFTTLGVNNYSGQGLKFGFAVYAIATGNPCECKIKQSIKRVYISGVGRDFEEARLYKPTDAPEPIYAECGPIEDSTYGYLAYVDNPGIGDTPPGPASIHAVIHAIIEDSSGKVSPDCDKIFEISAQKSADGTLSGGISRIRRPGEQGGSPGSEI